MSDPQDKHPSASTDETVLGSIPSGPHDSTLHADSKHAHSHAAAPARIVVPPPPLPPQTAPADSDALALPHDGLITMRKSGGFRFTSREVTVFNDGRLQSANSQRTSHVRPLAQQHVSDKQLADLRHLIAQAKLTQPQAAVGRQGPDTFVYELVVRVGRRVVQTSALEGSIPPSLAPLINALRQFMPADE